MKYILNRTALKCLLEIKTYQKDISVQFGMECISSNFLVKTKRNFRTLWDSDIFCGITGICRLPNPTSHCGIDAFLSGVHRAPCFSTPPCYELSMKERGEKYFDQLSRGKIGKYLEVWNTLESLGFHKTNLEWTYTNLQRTYNEHFLDIFFCHQASINGKLHLGSLTAANWVSFDF